MDSSHPASVLFHRHKRGGFSYSQAGLQSVSPLPERTASFPSCSSRHLHHPLGLAVMSRNCQYVRVLFFVAGRGGFEPPTECLCLDARRQLHPLPALGLSRLAFLRCPFRGDGLSCPVWINWWSDLWEGFRRLGAFRSRRLSLALCSLFPR